MKIAEYDSLDEAEKFIQSVYKPRKRKKVRQLNPLYSKWDKIIDMDLRSRYKNCLILDLFIQGFVGPLEPNGNIHMPHNGYLAVVPRFDEDLRAGT